MSKKISEEEQSLRKQYKAETNKNAMSGKKQSKGYTAWKKEQKELAEEALDYDEEEEIIDEEIEEEEIEYVEKIAKAEKEMARLDQLKSQLGNFKESIVDLQEMLPNESEFEFKAEKVHRLGRAIRLLQIIDKRFDELIGVIDEWMDRRIEIQLKNKQRRILKEEIA